MRALINKGLSLDKGGVMSSASKAQFSRTTPYKSNLRGWTQQHHAASEIEGVLSEYSSTYDGGSANKRTPHKRPPE